MGKYDSQMLKLSLDKALEAIRGAEISFKNDIISMGLNRIYYAIFYSVTALAYYFGFTTSKHLQLLGWFNKKFIHQDKIFPQEMMEIYRAALLNRQEADYSFSNSLEFTAEQVIKSMSDCKFFVKQVFDNLKVEYPKDLN